MLLFSERRLLDSYLQATLSHVVAKLENNGRVDIYQGLGNMPINDESIEIEIKRIETVIEKWIKSRDLWGDCKFWSHLDFHDAEPWKEEQVVTIFASEGAFNQQIDTDNELYEDFSRLLKVNGYWFERGNCRYYILPINRQMNEKYKDYFRWKWVQSLLKPDFNDIYNDIFEHFASNPDNMQKLTWREFEILVYEVLRNQGFSVELGPGSNDGGIDITVFARDSLGDILTAVQIKRYRSDRKIDLQAVQALHGAVCAHRMNRGMFVTTSSYLPSASKFAARENVTMDLYVSDDVAKWCKIADRGIVEDKEVLISKDEVAKTIHFAKRFPREYIVHANIGETMTINSFAVILKETKHAALLMTVPSEIVSHDGYKQWGYEIPTVDSNIEVSLSSNHQGFKAGSVVRAKKKFYGNEKYFWTGDHSYSFWREDRQYFNYLD